MRIWAEHARLFEESKEKIQRAVEIGLLSESLAKLLNKDVANEEFPEDPQRFEIPDLLTLKLVISTLKSTRNGHF